MTFFLPLFLFAFNSLTFERALDEKTKVLIRVEKTKRLFGENVVDDIFLDKVDNKCNDLFLPYYEEGNFVGKSYFLCVIGVYLNEVIEQKKRAGSEKDKYLTSLQTQNFQLQREIKKLKLLSKLLKSEFLSLFKNNDKLIHNEKAIDNNQALVKQREQKTPIFSVENKNSILKTNFDNNQEDYRNGTNNENELDKEVIKKIIIWRQENSLKLGKNLVEKIVKEKLFLWEKKGNNYQKKVSQFFKDEL